MARRRTRLERPYDALRRAAEAHAALVGEPAQGEQADEEAAPVAEEPPAEHHANAQHRDEGGKFA